MPPTVLIVEDEFLVRDMIVHEFALAGFELLQAASAEEALASLKPSQPDLVLADITLPGKSGLEFIKDMQAQYPQVPVLVMSMHDETLYAERVLRAGGRGRRQDADRCRHEIGAVAVNVGAVGGEPHAPIGRACGRTAAKRSIAPSARTTRSLPVTMLR